MSNPASHSADWHSLASRTRENFPVLSPLLPKRFREDFRTVYAFCRIADDLGDAEAAPTPAGRAAALARLAQFRERLIAGLDGGADDTDPLAGLWRSLANLTRRCPVRPTHLHDLIDAFERDQHQLRYATWADLISYCRKSADPVGRMVLALAGIDDADPANAELIRMSDATCTALQLVNHIQDVRRDLLERDRVYLPSAETGLSADRLRVAIETPTDHTLRVEVIRAVRPLLARTKELFKEGEPLGDDLRGTSAESLRKPVRLFHGAGTALCAHIERTGCTTLYRRRTLPKYKTLAVLLRVGIQ